LPLSARWCQPVFHSESIHFSPCILRASQRSTHHFGSSTSYARPSPVQTSHHNDDSYGVTQRGHFAVQFQNQPLQPPPSADAVGLRAASVSTTQIRRTMVRRVWSVRRPSIIQSQFYQAPPAAQQQPSTKSRSLHAGPTSAAHHKQTAPARLPHDPAPSAAHKYRRLLAAPATLARRDGLRGSRSPVFEFCCPTHIFE
jgi:hypothetical protein